MVYRTDWSLNRKGLKDAYRHKQKVLEAIRGNLQHILAEEAIITSEGDRIVKVPVRSIKEYHFRFGDFRAVGSGTGETKAGDVLGRHPKFRAAQAGGGPGAGDLPGEDYYEAEITVDELADLLFEELGLPKLRPKGHDEVNTDRLKYEEVRRQGPLQNINRRRTILENVRRRARLGEPRVGRITRDDLRFHSWEQEVRLDSSAVILAMRDISASMGEFEKYISRSFYFWMLRFLHSRYTNVRVVFIVHHTQAREVTEEAFFELGESGGTRASSAYNLALQVIAERFPPERFNIYPFHFSDGDNWPEDREEAVRSVEKLLAVSNVFGYGEIRTVPGRLTTLSAAFTAFKDNPRFLPVHIRQKEDVWWALKTFFTRSGDWDHAGPGN